jgi:predicted metal-dependent peptidase
MQMTAEDKVRKARTQLVLDEPFFGSLALKLKILEDQSCSTAWVDGTTLGYNPDFVNNLPYKHLVGLIAHEVMHCVGCHHARRGDRDHGRWNEAADHAINHILHDAGFELPEGGLMDDQYKGMDADSIYNMMPTPPPPPPKPQGGSGSCSGSEGDGDQDVPPAPELDDDEGQPDSTNGKGGNYGGCGEFRDAPSELGGQASPAELKEKEEDWKVAATQAAQVAKAMGNLAGSIERLVLDTIKPKVDWKTVLQRFMTSFAKNDFSWKRPNRRFLADDLILPSLHSETIDDVVIGVDTSCSIGQKEMDVFSAEVNGVLQAYDVTVHVVYCDTRINHTDTYTSPEDLPIKLSPYGGGGTSFDPVFDWANDLVYKGTDISCLIYLTDLECYMPPQPDYPVLWACTTDLVADWGETLKIQMK